MEQENFSDVKCPICDESGKWKNVDQYRYKPSGMSLCLGCGFITYPEVLTKTKDLTEFYRAEYREAPTFANICTGERKLHYHASFLGPLFDEWKAKGKARPAICEIGAAFGMFLNWIRQFFPQGVFDGTELTTSFKRNAFWLYGFELKDEIDTSKKYDLIASYKVAEHIPNIDTELRKYAQCLTDDGMLYISVPTWFGSLSNFGTNGFSIEYYYHKNHINVWTRKLFETLLGKCGLEIVRSNHTFYDDTYLCKRNDAMTSKTRIYEVPSEIEAKLEAVFKAASFYDQGKYEEAIAAYNDFPEAHMGAYEGNRAKLHKIGYEAIHDQLISRALSMCPISAAVRVMAADISMRYSKWEKALMYFGESLKMRPNDPLILGNMAHCFRQMAAIADDPGKAFNLLSEAKSIETFRKQTSLQSQQDAISWLMHDNAKLPTPHEAAVVKPDACQSVHS